MIKKQITSIYFDSSEYLEALEFKKRHSDYKEFRTNGQQNFIFEKETIENLKENGNNSGKINMLCIVGMTASGKDTLAHKIVESRYLNVFENDNPYEIIVSYTTRPMRAGETDGVEHYFISDQEYDKIDDQDKIAETQIGQYRYCSTFSQLDPNINYIYIIDPDGIEYLMDKFSHDLNIFTIYVHCDTDTRYQRYINRESQCSKISEIQEITKRFNERHTAEYKTFEQFKDSCLVDMVINSHQRKEILDKMDEKQRIELKVLYHDKEIDTIVIDPEQGNFIDLRAAKTYNLKKGEFALIDLGVSIKIPDGFWAQLVPRSSTFKNYGIIQTNSMGVIDTSYCGDDDVWMMPVYATRNTVINKNDRICQFRLVEDFFSKYELCWNQVDHLSDVSRGGFGSTGVN